MNIRDPKLRKAVIEFLIIVVGVLTALAADEWRQSIERDKVERELLEDIRKEFVANLDRFEEVTVFFENLREKLEALSAVSPEEFAALPAEDARALATAAHLPRPLLAPRTGVLRSVIDGGQLANISDRHLRYAIAEWPRSLEIIGAMEEQEFKWFLESWVPAMEPLFDARVDPADHSDKLLRAAGKQLYFVNGYLRSLRKTHEKTGTILSQLPETEAEL